MPARGPSITAGAPGSLMLLGEHAVLHGHRALVMAVNRRIRVALTPRADARFRIESALGTHESEVSDPAPHPAFRFIVEAISRARVALPSGFELRVESEFSHEIGFGSSAAVTVATVAALRRFAGLGAEVDAVRDEAIEIVRAVQGRGSGADVAASAHGGILLYRPEPREVRRLSADFSLLAVYCGYKTPTAEVIRRVEAAWRDRPDALRDLYARIGALVEAGASALERDDLTSFGATLNNAHALMADLGVSTPELDTIVSHLRQQPGCLGAKISGSGMGDCAIGLDAKTFSDARFPAETVFTDPHGLLI